MASRTKRRTPSHSICSAGRIASAARAFIRTGVWSSFTTLEATHMSKEWHLQTPLSEEDVRKLALLDVVYLTGKMWGIRDENLRRHLDHGQPLPEGVDYRGYPLLHEAAGYKRNGEEWVFTSGMGNTTSTRMERWMPLIVERHGCRAI